MPPKILIVDDATFIRDMVKRVLRQRVDNVEILEAPDGSRAVSIIKKHAPDIILSDWEMPQMSGDELLRWVRSTPAHSETPFVMITSRGDRDHVVSAAEAGVNDYLSKPFTADELYKKVSKQLKRIGYEGASSASKAPGGPFSSLEVLTGGKAGQQAPRGKPADACAGQSSAKGKALIRLPGASLECDIQDLTLQAMNCTLPRPESIPAVFEQAAVDILDEQGDALARLNAYIHAVSAIRPSPDSEGLRVIVRFVDKDPVKLEALSRWIAK